MMGIDDERLKCRDDQEEEGGSASVDASGRPD